MSGGGRALRALVVIAGMAWAGTALAHQWAEVVVDLAPAHDLPNGTSPVLMEVPKGTRLPVSDQMVKDVFGEYWFKTKLESGTFAYVSAKTVRTDRTRNAQMGAGLQERVNDETSLLPEAWTFVARLMLGAGMVVGAPGVGFAGEGEFTFTPFLKSIGYDRRILSAGVFFSLASQNSASVTAFGASGVYRVFTHTRLEPELRLRLGVLSAGSASAFAAGLCAGVRYPFSNAMGEKQHLAGYAEAQGLMGLASPSAVLVSFALGIGYHF